MQVCKIWYWVFHTDTMKVSFWNWSCRTGPCNKSLFSLFIFYFCQFFLSMELFPPYVCMRFFQSGDSVLHKPKFWMGVNFCGGIFRILFRFNYQILSEKLGGGVVYPGGSTFKRGGVWPSKIGVRPPRSPLHAHVWLPNNLKLQLLNHKNHACIFKNTKKNLPFQQNFIIFVILVTRNDTFCILKKSTNLAELCSEKGIYISRSSLQVYKLNTILIGATWKRGFQYETP